jgi:Tfp pilus assembly protein PilX
MSFYRFVLLLVILLCILCDARCASRQLSQRVAEQQSENAQAIAIAERSIADDTERRIVTRALKNSNALLAETDTARQIADERAKAAQTDAEKWRLIKWGSVAALIAAIVLAFRRYVT